MTHDLLYRPDDGGFVAVLTGDDIEDIDPGVFRAVVHFRELLLRIYLNWSHVVRIPLDDVATAESREALEALPVAVIRGDDVEELRAGIKIVR
ncbi:MAG: hypothetical protein ACI4AX_09385 [Muribaculaceae bacterium]